MRIRPAVATDRVLTIPNLLTLVRLACVPVFLWLLLRERQRTAAAVLLGGLGVTDFADGWLARRLEQGSAFGKMLDPIADRLLLLVAAGGIVAVGAVPVWFAVAVLAREGAVALGTLVLTVAGARRIDVTFLGKAGTFGLMVSLPFFLVGEPTGSWRLAAQATAWGIGVPALVLSYWAALGYLPRARCAVRDAHAMRAGPYRQSSDPR